MAIKKVVILTHRYLGTGLAALFAIWFASGIVMVFVGFPRLTEERRLARLPPLEIAPGIPAPAALSVKQPPAGRVRLGLLEARPVYRFVDGSRAGVLGADDGKVIASVSTAVAARLAARLLEAPSSFAEILPLDRRDQWNTTSPRLAQFPLLRFAGADVSGAQIDVSLVTAEVVQATSRSDRLWAWLGAIPHWIYPIALRRHAEAWRWLVIVLSALGCVVCLAGIMLGIWNLRLVEGAGGRGDERRLRIPYRKRWLRQHHILGLAFGVLVFSWTASGMLSLNPFRWSDGANASDAEDEAFAGGRLAWEKFTLTPARALEACRREIVPRELELRQVAGRPHYLCRESPDRTRLVPADTQLARTLATLPVDLALKAAQTLMSRVPILEAVVLEHGDAYHYAEPFAGQSMAPVLRLKLGDRDATWYYLDLSDGSIAKRYTWRGRLERWLYNGLHSLAFPALYARPHLWRITIVSLCLLGSLVSATGVLVGLAWIRRVQRRRDRDVHRNGRA